MQKDVMTLDELERLAGEATPRTEGWGSLDNAAAAHYFVGGKSLCGRWLAWGSPRWESNQEDGPEPKRGSGTCKACWKKRAALSNLKQAGIDVAERPTSTPREVEK